MTGMLNLLEDRARWHETLADREAVWCAFCLTDILDVNTFQSVRFPPQALEEHHPLTQSTFRDVVQELLPTNFPVGWTVPAHRECHERHYADGFRVASVLRHALAVSDLAYRDNWAQQRHDVGVYWLAMIMNAHTLKHFGSHLEASERAPLIERQLAAGGGVRSRIHPIPLSEIATVPDEHKTRVFNHLANRRANRGNERAAREAFTIAQAFRHKTPRAESDLVELSSVNRRAQVERTAKAGRNAVTEARRVVGSSGYSYLTALLLYGWNSLSEEDVKALTPFDEVLAHLESASWLYVAEALFGKACHALRFNATSVDRVYQWLCQAQYIYVVLGLQGQPLTHLAKVVPVPDGTSCFPGHVIQTPLFAVLNPTQRFELRREAIGNSNEVDWLYRSLLDALSGQRGDRTRIARLLE
jgi:hypothetical protein